MDSKKEIFKKIKTIMMSFLKSVYKHFFYIFVLFSVWMAFEQTILSFIPGLNSWSNEIQVSSAVWLIILSISLVILCVLFLVPRLKRTYRPSGWMFANVLLIVIIYTHYRFFSDEFVFWGWRSIYWLDILYLIFIVYAGFYICHYIHKPLSNAGENVLLRDDAEDDAINDILGYSEHVSRFAKLLDTIDLNRRAYSVGIVGEWGVGKSTFLNILAKQQTDKIVVRYNPRSAKTAVQIQEEFFNQLRSELGKYSGLIGPLLNKYAYALQLTTHSKWLCLFWDIFTNWTVDSEKEKINQVIQSLGRRIYVIIEDLDRLTGEEILEVLKLIDANGNFSHMVFITAYDKMYVNRVLNRKLQLENYRTDFTDKYFQYEFPLPKPRRIHLSELLKKLIYDWIISIIPKKDVKHLEEEWESVRLYLLSNLSTIRQIKRFANLLRSLYAPIKNNVVFSDFVLLTLIQFLDSDAYWSIYNRKFISNRKTFQTLDYYYLSDDYKDKIGQSTKIQHFDAILRFLFDTNGIRQFQELNRICRLESFENYFYDKTGNLQIEDLLTNSKISTDDAIKELARILENEKKYNEVIEFLCLYEADWIGNRERLFHYLCLLIYADAVCVNTRLFTRLKQHLFLDLCQMYIEQSIVTTESEYSKVVYAAFDYMIKFVPYDVAFLMVKRLEGRSAFDVDEDVVLTSDDKVTLALKAQLQYDNMYGTDQWNALKSLDIAQISKSSNKVLVPEAGRQINKMLNAHADEYAASILNVYSNSSENAKNKRSWVDAPKMQTLISYVRGQKEFREWMNRILSDDLRFIMEKLYDEMLNNNNARLQIPYISSENETNYALIAEKMKSVPIATIEQL